LPEGRLTLVLGGARSGKSRRAEAIIERSAPPWTYVATSQAFDDEMRERIAHHQARRDERWQTVEAPLDLAGVLEKCPPDRPVLVDCLTLWLSNVILAEADTATAFDRSLAVLSRPRGQWVVVSNEVGMGIVPDNALARRFRDEAGRLNQMVAAVADSVELVVAGIPLTVK
jgi:adenosylcobinamide kinase/adenosylcobinamide-phosphate guanylyltransferase